MVGAIQPVGRRFRRRPAFLGALVLAIILMGLTAATSGANPTYFCPSGGGSAITLPTGHKCNNSNYQPYFNLIDAYIENSPATSYNLCVLAKQQYAPGGGTGGNTMPLECTANHYSYAQTAPGTGYSNDGYAEIYNMGPQVSTYGSFQ